MKKLLFLIVSVFATAFLVLAVHHIIGLTEAGLIRWDR